MLRNLVARRSATVGGHGAQPSRDSLSSPGFRAPRIGQDTSSRSSADIGRRCEAYRHRNDYSPLQSTRVGVARRERSHEPCACRRRLPRRHAGTRDDPNESLGDASLAKERMRFRQPSRVDASRQHALSLERAQRRRCRCLRPGTAMMQSATSWEHHNPISERKRRVATPTWRNDASPERKRRVAALRTGSNPPTPHAERTIPAPIRCEATPRWRLGLGPGMRLRA